ncbi:MAG: ORF6N domain-containing protein [Kiritimatiellae bacterium]|nr:ORF6N domain-containing protein [Kiritimatiellia bacterium]
MTITALVLRSPDQCITCVRGHTVILDSDPAALYGVPVK